jgi:hypothetical protein
MLWSPVFDCRYRQFFFVFVINSGYFAVIGCPCWVGINIRAIRLLRIYCRLVCRLSCGKKGLQTFLFNVA